MEKRHIYIYSPFAVPLLQLYRGKLLHVECSRRRDNRTAHCSCSVLTSWPACRYRFIPGPARRTPFPVCLAFCFLASATPADTTHLMHFAICSSAYFRCRSSFTHFIRLTSLLLPMPSFSRPPRPTPRYRYRTLMQLWFLVDSLVVFVAKLASSAHWAPTSTKDYMLENKMKL